MSWSCSLNCCKVQKHHAEVVLSRNCRSLIEVKSGPSQTCSRTSQLFVRLVVTMLWITYIQAYMPYESPENPSNEPQGPMGLLNPGKLKLEMLLWDLHSFPRILFSYECLCLTTTDPSGSRRVLSSIGNSSCLWTDEKCSVWDIRAHLTQKESKIKSRLREMMIMFCVFTVEDSDLTESNQYRAGQGIIPHVPYLPRRDPWPTVHQLYQAAPLHLQS